MLISKKRIAAIAAITLVAAVSVTGVVSKFSAPKMEPILNQNSLTKTSNTVKVGNENAPKYVFMFVGDGMSHVQTQMANYYLDALDQDTKAALEGGSTILKSEDKLSFFDYDSVGITTTYDSTSFTPDSASTATSIATGEKTHSGVIAMNEDFTKSYDSMATKLKEQLGYKVGIVSSVTINHATPAAFYANNESRNNYYEIGLDLVESDFDYFAGGEISKHDSNGESIYSLAEKAGYKVVLKDQDEAEKVTADDGKVIIIGEDAKGALPYELDREEDMWALSDYVSKGIEVLDNDNGFFMMVEAGKIDWACHANDALASIMDTIAFDNAIQEAYKFYEEHPEDTLIVVTGDHETGGMTIGYAGTKYDTFLDQLTSQTVSNEVFDTKVDEFREKKVEFDDVMYFVEKYFGLSTKENSPLKLTDYELNKIKTAYEVSINGLEVDKTEYALNYGGYEPLTVTLMHVLNNKSGVDFTSFSHTGVTVGTYAQGVGAENFDGFYDNTEIYDSIESIMGLK